MLKKIVALLATSLMIVTAGYAADETFEASIRVLAALAIVENTALTFPDTESRTIAQNVTVSPGSTGAASFNVYGEHNRLVNASIVEPSASATIGSSTVVFDSFSCGGALSGACQATLDNSGYANGAEIGATAHIPANAQAGLYQGTLTFRVTYN